MSEINTNAVLDGITLALRAEYPDSRIDAKMVEQGLKTPAFNVKLVAWDQTQLVGQRWRRLTRFDVRYFPRSGPEDCYWIADELAGVLALIRTPQGDALRGTSMSSEVVDGVLHFLVSYNYTAFLPESIPEMEELTLHQGG